MRTRLPSVLFVYSLYLLSVQILEHQRVVLSLLPAGLGHLAVRRLLTLHKLSVGEGGRGEGDGEGLVGI